MKIKYPYDILIIGIFSSWLLGFLFFLFQSLLTQDKIPIMFCLGLVGNTLLLLYKSKFDKFDDQSKLIWVESFFLVGNLVTIVIALSIFLVTFSQYWLAKELRYFSLVFGLPSIFAVIYWNLHKGRKTMN